MGYQKGEIKYNGPQVKIMLTAVFFVSGSSISSFIVLFLVFHFDCPNTCREYDFTFFKITVMFNNLKLLAQRIHFPHYAFVNTLINLFFIFPVLTTCEI